MHYVKPYPQHVHAGGRNHCNTCLYLESKRQRNAIVVACNTNIFYLENGWVRTISSCRASILKFTWANSAWRSSMPFSSLWCSSTKCLFMSRCWATSLRCWRSLFCQTISVKLARDSNQWSALKSYSNKHEHLLYARRIILNSWWGLFRKLYCIELTMFTIVGPLGASTTAGIT